MDASTRGRIGALESWARTPDRSARTAPARRALLDKFEQQVPAEITDPQQRAAAAERLKRAHYLRMAARSAEVRAAKMRTRAATLEGGV